MSDYAPGCPDCTPVFIWSREGDAWFHSVTCTTPEIRIAAPARTCPHHYGEPLFECRGCLQTFERERETRGAEF